MWARPRLPELTQPRRPRSPVRCFPITFPVQGKCFFTDTYGAPRSGGRLHEGVDLIAKTGQYVYAAASGTLTRQYLDAPGSLSGNGWRLTTADGTFFFYAHFSGFPPGLAVGSKVVAGQVIGYVGETGNAGTPHLHFEIHPGGGLPVNPTQSVKAVDGCAITTIPTAGTNPANPTAGKDTPATAPPPLAPAVRVSLSGAGTATTGVVATTPTTPTAASSGRWELIEPVVLFNGTGSTMLTANTTRQISIAGITGVSASVVGLMVRASATATTAGTVAVHPALASLRRLPPCWSMSDRWQSEQRSSLCRAGRCALRPR